MSNLSTSVFSDQKGSLQLEQDKIEAEVGPIKYVAELIYGENAQDNFDKAVRFVILILIFVFDPLAVLLLIAANISLRQWRMKKQLTQSKKQEDIKGMLERQKKSSDFPKLTDTSPMWGWEMVN